MQQAGPYQGPLAPNQKMVGLRRCTRPPLAVWRAMYMSLVFMISSSTTASTSNHAAAHPAHPTKYWSRVQFHPFRATQHHLLHLAQQSRQRHFHIWHRHACNALPRRASLCVKYQQVFCPGQYARRRREQTCSAEGKGSRVQAYP